MTNDLVKRLLAVCPEAPGDDRTRWHLNPDGPEAASRIEELEKRVHQAKIVFATMRSEMRSVCAVMEAFENE